MKYSMHLILLGFFAPVISCSFTGRDIYRPATRLTRQADVVRTYLAQKQMSTTYCFLVDMSIPSNRKRFFVYDLKKNLVVYSGLVAHGSCDKNFLEEARFSNTPGGGCTSLGKYKVGYSYKGQYGKAYKLYGLESTNSNAYARAVVLHGYTCVPDEETDRPICNSLGCTMVSYNFLHKLSAIIDDTKQPVLLWVYE